MQILILHEFAQMLALKMQNTWLFEVHFTLERVYLVLPKDRFKNFS